jgi:hypothetical protein
MMTHGVTSRKPATSALLSHGFDQTFCHEYPALMGERICIRLAFGL